MSTKSKSLYLLLVGVLLLQACALSQVQPTPQPTQTQAPPTPTQPSPTPTVPPFEPVHLGMVWPTNETKLVGGAVAPDGIIYAMDEDGVLHAVDSNGVELWAYKGDDYKYASSPYLSKALIYIFTDNQNLVGINFEGKEEWKFDIQGRVTSAPVVAPDGSIYVEIYNRNSQDFKSDVYHLMTDGTYDKFDLEFMESLDSALVDSKGDLYLWGWKNLTIFSPSGEIIKECDQKGSSRLISNLVFGSNDELLYVIEGGPLMAMGSDCAALWNIPLEKKEGNDVRYQLFYDRSDVLYIGGSDGSLVALDGKSRSVLWKSETHPEIGGITAIVPLEDGLVYVLTSQARVAAFDLQGEMKWLDELYWPAAPDRLYSLPTNEVALFQGGKVLIYTYDPAKKYEFPAATTLPISEEQAREEIVSFVLDFIVVDEIGGTADYIRTADMPWVSSAPEANIIVYTPAKKNAGNSWDYLDSDHPIKVWWYADNTLTEVDDMQKAIDEYRKNHMENPASDIFAWGYYDFGIIEVSQDFRSAKIYVGVSCGPLCGHGYFYWLQRSPSGEWWIYDSQHLWQS